MQNPEILHNGKPVTFGYALSLAKNHAQQSGWDPQELSSIWSRLLDARGPYEDRLECAELITGLTRDELEFFVPEPTD